MPVYLAFLRGINLGATRKFAKPAIITATEAAGGSEVATHINTGNVRLTAAARSTAAVKKALEQSYAAAAGFEVPVIVFRPTEFAAMVERGNAHHDEVAPTGKHYVTLYDAAPSAAAVTALQEREFPGETCVVEGRAAYALLDGNIHTSKLLASKEFKALGTGTARGIEVLRTIAEKWL